MAASTEASQPHDKADGQVGPRACRRDEAPALTVMGIACVDILVDVPHFPQEDMEMRASNIHKLVQQTALSSSTDRRDNSCTRRRCRGGNAANTAAVAADLSDGNLCVTFAGVSVDPAVCDGAAFVLADLGSHGVRPAVHMLAAGSTPTSYILRSAQSSSRTIIHHRNIQELSHDAFLASCVPALTPQSSCALHWLHAEGRHAAHTACIMQWHMNSTSVAATASPAWLVSRRAAALTAAANARLVSVEIEKTRSQHGEADAPDQHSGDSELSLLPLAHVVFSCREYASQVAGGDAAALCLLLLQASARPVHPLHVMEEYNTHCPMPYLPEVVVTWGEGGAYAFVPGRPKAGAAMPAGARVLLWKSIGHTDTLHWADGQSEAAGPLIAGTLHHVPAPPVHAVLDTVGAGDSFIAGALTALCTRSCSEVSFLRAVQCSVHVASAKVEQEGMNGLRMPLLKACAAPVGP